MERRGYLSAGPYVPVVNVEHPEVLRQLYEEFVHAGSDVVLAFTYYAYREKLRVLDREKDLEAINKAALKMAREVANKHGCLMAENICNSAVYVTGDKESHKITEDMFKIEIAVEMGADFIVGETFMDTGEAMLALECIKKYGQGVPAVITLSPSAKDTLVDGVSVVEACKNLEEAEAVVVGLNCFAGPDTMLPLLKQIKEVCKGPIAALPVPYNTTVDEPVFTALTFQEQVYDIIIYSISKRLLISQNPYLIQKKKIS